MDSMNRLNYSTGLVRGDANTRWHFVHGDFHADRSAAKADFRKIYLSKWHVVLPKRAARDKLHFYTLFGTV